MKLLTARTMRDYAYLKLIAFLELLAASIMSVSLTFFVFLAGLSVMLHRDVFHPKPSGEVKQATEGSPKQSRPEADGGSRWNARLPLASGDAEHIPLCRHLRF